MGGMAVQTAQALVYTKWSPVILRTKLAQGVGGVTLGAKPLCGIRRDLDRLTIVSDGRDWQLIG